MVNLLIWRFKNKYNLLYSDTHQEILNKFSNEEKIKYQKLFKTFEILKYSKKNILFFEIRSCVSKNFYKCSHPQRLLVKLLSLFCLA